MLNGEGVETVKLHIQVEGENLLFSLGLEGITPSKLQKVKEMQFHIDYCNGEGEMEEIILGILPVMVDGLDVFGILDAHTQNSLESQTLKNLLEQFNESHIYKKRLH